jgi:hypothetical protein
VSAAEATVHEKRIAARQRLMTDARGYRGIGGSASDWEARVGDEEPAAVKLLGPKELAAIVQLVWFKKRPRSGGRR